MHTKQQVRDGSKDVTRRLGWWFLKPDDRVMLVEQAMGIPKGEKIKRIRPVEIVSTRPEPLNAITQEEVDREGFPDMTPKEFVEWFSGAMRCPEDEVVNRIEWDYLERA